MKTLKEVVCIFSYLAIVHTCLAVTTLENLSSANKKSEEIDFDRKLLGSLLLPLGLDEYNDELRDFLYDGDTSSLNELFDASMQYLENLPATSQLLAGLSKTLQDDNDSSYTNIEDEEIKRIAHWVHFYNRFSEWSDEQTSDELLGVVTYIDDRLENICSNSILIPVTPTTEFEQALGAPDRSCLKSILSTFYYQKYVGIKELYIQAIKAGEFATDGATLIIQNIYEAVYVDIQDGRHENAMVGDYLSTLVKKMKYVFAGRQCTSESCPLSEKDYENCLALNDTKHIERNCTSSQDFIDYYTEWNMNFLVSGVPSFQDSGIPKLIFPRLRERGKWGWERTQSLYVSVASSLIRALLNPFKKRHFFDRDTVSLHAEKVLNNLEGDYLNLTRWKDYNDLPTNGIDPSDDPASAMVGDWIAYFDELYPPSKEPLFQQFVAFLRARVIYGICIPDTI